MKGVRAVFKWLAVGAMSLTMISCGGAGGGGTEQVALLYFLHNGEVFRLDINDRELSIIYADSGLGHIRVNEAGTYLTCIGMGLTIVNTETLEAASFQNYRLADWMPQQDVLVAYSDITKQIDLISQNGTMITSQFYKPAGNNQIISIDVSPLGDKILLTESGSSGIQWVTIDIDGTSRTEVAPGLDKTEPNPRWNRDATKIVYSYQLELYTIDADGTNIQKLTSSDVYESQGAFRKDGSIVVTAWQTTHQRYGLFTVPATGGTPQVLFDSPGMDSHPEIFEP
ncbi:MAG: hypothetical protein KDC26_12255 [Armatimonadetes bacterium]|nr:hypothetical protein [Armatimonadota bacterium]